MTHDPLLYITDIALDQWNILYAVSYDVLYVCDGQTVSCTKIATLNDNFNAFTLVRRGVVHQDREALVLISDAGEWSWVELGDGTATLHTMGFYGSDYESVGDAFSVNKMGTFGAVRKDGVTGTIIVSCDPQTGEALSEIITLPDEYNRVFGLAGWDGEVFAFDASGSILSVNVSANTWEEVAVTAFYWWGAGTSTAAAY
ncbi:hypothetical protein KAI87_03140 [Myxococcota bacterium]|nr:hypothetical protein [Myxococcota bacterium]